MFCPKCGTNVPDGTGFCPSCGTKLGAAAPQQQFINVNAVNNAVNSGINTMVNNVNVPAATGANVALFNTLATIAGIVSIVLSILGALLWGFIPALIGLLLGAGALVFGIMAKKGSNNQKGTAGFVCGIIGAAFGLIFFIGCLACGCGEWNYMEWGCVGNGCMIQQSSRGLTSLEDGLEDALYSVFRDIY